MASGGPDLRLTELLGAISLATDLGTGQPLAHGVRTTVLAAAIAADLGFPGAEIETVRRVALLRFLGCTADAAGTARLAAGDDLAFFAAMAPATMGSGREMARALIGAAGAGAPPARRVRLVAGALADPQGAKRSLSAHCEVAAMLAARLGTGEAVRTALSHAYERHDGKGYPDGLSGDEVPPAIRVAAVARDADLWWRIARDDWEGVLAARTGRAYHPAVAAACARVGPSVLAALDAGDPWRMLLAGQQGGGGDPDGDLDGDPDGHLDGDPDGHLVGDPDGDLDGHLVGDPDGDLVGDPDGDPDGDLDGDLVGDLDGALAVIADFADLKSAWTRGHSRRVSDLAGQAAGLLGLPPEQAADLRRAGLVHNLGVAGVPTGLVDKPGPLGAAEWERVRLHPYLSERVLGMCPALAPLARLAGAHHERLDGSGYHRGAPGSGLDRPARVLAAADVVAALGEDRPHRAGLAAEESRAAVSAEVAAGRLDREAADAVLAAAGMARGRPAPSAWPAGLSQREVEVLRLIARGRTNKEAAALLHVSAKTIGRHIENLYAKIGVSSRAAAAVFAMEHRLLS